MKKYFLLSLSAALIIGQLSAQVQTGIKTLPDVTVTANSNVNKSVTDAFQKSFSNVSNVKWFRLNKDYLVTFITADMNNRALYKKNGAMVYHISYGHEQNLPPEVRQVVKSNYVDYNITNAINVRQDNRNIWVVNLEYPKKLVIVRVEDGNLEEVYNYTRTL